MIATSPRAAITEVIPISSGRPARHERAEVMLRMISVIAGENPGLREVVRDDLVDGLVGAAPPVADVEGGCWPGGGHRGQRPSMWSLSASRGDLEAHERGMGCWPRPPSPVSGDGTFSEGDLVDGDDVRLLLGTLDP